MIDEKKEHTSQDFESKVSDSKFGSFESVTCADIKVEMATLRELTVPNLETQPLSITYPTLDQPLKLNSIF